MSKYGAYDEKYSTSNMLQKLFTVWNIFIIQIVLVINTFKLQKSKFIIVIGFGIQYFKTYLAL